MARPRIATRADLPENLYVGKRSGGDYFTYRSPILGRAISLGYDREQAVAYATEANMQVEEDRKRSKEHSQTIKHAKFDDRGLLDGNSIVRKAIRYDQVCGIYFLIHDNNIVYVGQSTSILQRLAAHRRDTSKVFTSFYFIECKGSELDHLEALYIDQFRPVYNKTIPYVAPNATAWSGSLSDILSV